MNVHSRKRAPIFVVGLAATAVVIAGCTGGGGGSSTEADIEGDFAGETLNVVAAWSGAEQENFEAVLKGFEDATGATVNYTSFGDNGPTYIQGQLEGGTPPNVAVIGQPALLQSLAANGDIIALDGDVKSAVEDNYSESWIDLGSVDGELYGVWFKAANKSTVWYNADIYDEAGAEAPEGLGRLPRPAPADPGLRLLRDLGRRRRRLAADRLVRERLPAHRGARQVRPAHQARDPVDRPVGRPRRSRRSRRCGATDARPAGRRPAHVPGDA